MTDFNSSLTSIAESLFMNMWWWKYFMQKYSGIEFDYFFGGSGLMIIKKQRCFSCQKHGVYNIWLQVLTSCQTL